MTPSDRGTLDVVEERRVLASFETPRARIIGHSYKAKDHLLKLVVELPADPAFASAMLRMRDELVRIRIVCEEQEEDGDLETTPSMFD
jgi:hypothetical protein